MRLGSLCLAAALWLGASAMAAPVEIGPDAMRRLAAEALAAGQVETAQALTRALLTRDPEDATALILAAEAAVRAKDWAGAARLAAAAHGRVEGPARFRAARLAAFALTQQGRFTRAQIWLRRASPDAPDPAARAGLAADYRAVAARNPLALRLGFGVAPSSNVNGGSRSETLSLPGLPVELELSGAARALSGTAVTGSAGARYGIAAPALPGPAWINLQAEGRGYRLSDSARRQAPEARGADFAQAALLLGLTQRFERPEMPIDLSVEVARHWYGGDPYVDTLRFGLARPLLRRPRARLDLALAAQYSDRLDTGTDWWTPTLRLGWSMRLDNADGLGLSARLRRQTGDAPDLAHDGLTLGIDYDVARPLGPARLGFGIEAEWRDYPESRYSLAGRQDAELRLEGRVALPGQERYGFYPEIGIETRRSWSDVDLFDEEAGTLSLGLRSAF